MSSVMSLVLWVAGGLLIGPYTTGLGDWLKWQLLFLLDLSFFVALDRNLWRPSKGPPTSDSVANQCGLTSSDCDGLWKAELVASRRGRSLHRKSFTERKMWSQTGADGSEGTDASAD